MNSLRHRACARAVQRGDRGLQRSKLRRHITKGRVIRLASVQCCLKVADRSADRRVIVARQRVERVLNSLRHRACARAVQRGDRITQRTKLRRNFLERVIVRRHTVLQRSRKVVDRCRDRGVIVGGQRIERGLDRLCNRPIGRVARVEQVDSSTQRAELGRDFLECVEIGQNAVFQLTFKAIDRTCNGDAIVGGQRVKCRLHGLCNRPIDRVVGVERTNRAAHHTQPSRNFLERVEIGRNTVLQLNFKRSNRICDGFAKNTGSCIQRRRLRRVLADGSIVQRCDRGGQTCDTGNKAFDIDVVRVNLTLNVIHSVRQANDTWVGNRVERGIEARISRIGRGRQVDDFAAVDFQADVKADKLKCARRGEESRQGR